MIMRMIVLILGLPLVPILSAISLMSCGADAPTSQEQLDVVITTRQPDYRFDQATTYALPDKVAVISDPETPPAELDPALSEHVLQSIGSQFDSRGYSRVSPGGDAPSIFVEVSKMSTVVTDAYYSAWYGYYGAAYAPYYGTAYGAGWAPVAVPYVVSATVGALIINVTDPNAPNTADKTIPSVWAAVLNGVVDNSSQAQIQQRVDSGIQQAFEQSPYLTRSVP